MLWVPRSQRPATTVRICCANIRAINDLVSTAPVAALAVGCGRGLSGLLHK